MGNKLEFRRAGEIRQEFGDLTESKTILTLLDNEYTDDTCMMLAIGQSLINNRGLNIMDITQRFYRWMVEDGRGIGLQTQEVLTRYGNQKGDILSISKAFWEEKHQSPAGNGGVMRTAPVGLFFHQNPFALREAAIKICQITHWDPRCTESCVAVSSAIADLLHDHFELNSILTLLTSRELKLSLEEASSTPINKMILDGRDQGYTILTTKVAFAALIQAPDFKTGMLEVLRRGGDADTNGIVAGALLGAKFGMRGIPEKWLVHFKQRSEIDRIAEDLLALI
jgi:ADP-ribosylglycohydrolase